MNIKNFQNSFECVLTVKTSVSEPALFLIPVCKSTIIERLFGIFYNERNYIKPKALFQSNQSADSAVSVLERVNIFEVRMKLNMLLSQNVPIQTVSKYMGHSDSSITLQVYSHFIPDTQEKVVNAINLIESEE